MAIKITIDTFATIKTTELSSIRIMGSRDPHSGKIHFGTRRWDDWPDFIVVQDVVYSIIESDDINMDDAKGRSLELADYAVYDEKDTQSPVDLTTMVQV